VKYALAVACAYEAGSILSGKTPTFTQLSARHRWLAPAIIAVLTVHLYRAQRTREEVS
jgi:hypothetical protein